MTSHPIGKILRAETRAFVFGCKVPRTDVPIFGSLVKVTIQYRSATVYGLIYNIAIEDDGMTKMLSVADEVRQEDIDWQRARRVPVEAAVLCAAYRETGAPIRYALPGQPPITLDGVHLCDDEELRQFTATPEWMRLILESRDAPCDELLAATIRQAADARPAGARETFITQSGRELARLLANDALRLEGLLRRLS
jgi:hypothetical protein